MLRKSLIVIVGSVALVGCKSSGSGGAAPDGGAAPGVKDAAAAEAAVIVSPPITPAQILPVIQISVPGVVLETVGAVPVSGDMTIIQDHDGTHADLGTRPLSFQAAISVATRTAIYASGARTFTIQVRDSASRPQTGSLLGLPYQGDWVLLPCWQDKTCMRNNLAFAMAAALGTGGPRTRYVEVFFNRDYQGLYQLLAPARQGQGRIELPAGPGDSGDALTGAYVFRRSGIGETVPSAPVVNDWVSPTKAPGTFPNQLVYSYVYPPVESITGPQRDYLRTHVARFEEAMAATTWADPVQGYRAWIDLPSWHDFAVIAEVSNNSDAYWRNEILTKARDAGGVRGKLSMTPLWDFTIGFGNSNSRNGWRTDRLAFNTAVGNGDCADVEWVPQSKPVCDDFCCAVPFCRPPQRCWNMPFVPFWWERIRNDPAFRDEARCRYKELRRTGGPFDIARINQLIDGWKAEIGPNAMARHLMKWPGLMGSVGQNPYAVDPRTAPVPNSAPAVFFDKEVQWFRDWVTSRLGWLDSNLPGVCSAAGETPDAGSPPDQTPGQPDTVELTRGLVGYWKLDDGAGTVARDSSPQHNDGMLMGLGETDWTTAGFKQGGLNFTPTKIPVVVVPNAPSLNPTTGITLAAWVNSTDWLGTRRFIQKGNTDNQYRLQEDAGLIRFHLVGVTNGSIYALLPANGEFHHVAGTYDGMTIRIYVDGRIITEDVALGAIATTANNLHIGERTPTSTPGNAFSGVLDEVVVYDRGLNPTEVARLAAGVQPL
jgi:CotH kinase protein/Concanavalin A-like lectin/glucanases superfamily